MKIDLASERDVLIYVTIRILNFLGYGAFRIAAIEKINNLDREEVRIITKILREKFA